MTDEQQLERPLQVTLLEPLKKRGYMETQKAPSPKKGTTAKLELVVVKGNVGAGPDFFLADLNSQITKSIGEREVLFCERISHDLGSWSFIFLVRSWV